MNYYYKVYIVFSDKKLLKTIIRTDNLGRSIEKLINDRPNARAISIKALEINETEAKEIIERKTKKW